MKQTSLSPEGAESDAEENLEETTRLRREIRPPLALTYSQMGVPEYQRLNPVRSRLNPNASGDTFSPSHGQLARTSLYPTHSMGAAVAVYSTTAGMDKPVLSTLCERRMSEEMCHDSLDQYETSTATKELMVVTTACSEQY